MSEPLPTVIIPVFNAYEHLNSCLDSIAVSSPGIKILLINDASTDERVGSLLESWLRNHPQHEILNNSQNRGFVYSVNRGMSHVSGNVVLLNSDTIVTPRWLEALADCLASDMGIGTATPWSNNGEIVSFPIFCSAAPVPPDPAWIAEVIRSCGPPVYPDLPTAVGFCMAISRRAIEQVGLFDEASFGRGYGEENDFSMRVAEAGMRNVLCDEAYVAHHGGQSFAPLGLKPDAASMNRLLGKHPGYQALVDSFIQADSLSGRRQALIDAVERHKAGIS